MVYCVMSFHRAFITKFGSTKRANPEPSISNTHFTRSSDEYSVRPSITRVNCDKTVERLSRFLYHTKDHLA